jgi:hypothetical protein
MSRPAVEVADIVRAAGRPLPGSVSTELCFQQLKLRTWTLKCCDPRPSSMQYVPNKVLLTTGWPHSSGSPNKIAFLVFSRGVFPVKVALFWRATLPSPRSPLLLETSH